MMYTEVKTKATAAQFGKWIDHAHIENGTYYAVTNEHQGQKKFHNMSSRRWWFPGLWWSNTSSKRFIEIPLQDLQPKTSSIYCRNLELPAPSFEGHMVWSYPYRDETFQIPAIVLQRGLFQMGKRYQHLLYRPNSPYELFSPSAGELIDCDKLPRTGALNLDNGLTSLPRTLLWTTCFPSALKAWASIWRLGLRGTVGLELPRATVIAQIKGESVGDQTFVREFKTVRIATDESPFPFVQVPAAKWNILGRWSDMNVRRHWTQTSEADPFPSRPLFYTTSKYIYPLEPPC